MAKRRKGTSKKPRVFRDCGNKKGCKITRRPAGARAATPFGFSYTTQAKPCNWAKGKPRKTCPVQLFFNKGVPTIRLCTERGKAGPTFAVSSPQEAQRIAAEACKCWEKNKSFDRCAVLKRAQGLGKTRRKTRRKKAS